MTSASWTFEARYQFPHLTGSGAGYAASQSLCRFQVTSTLAPADTGAAILNVVAVSGSDRIELWTRPASGTTDTYGALNIFLTGVDVFDGDNWSVSFGRFRGDDPELAEAYTGTLPEQPNSSASYFLRAAKADEVGITRRFVTQSFYLESEDNDPTDITWQTTGTINSHAPNFIIGSQSLPSSRVFLHTSSLSPTARATEFEGHVGHIRFWSKGLLEREWDEHVRNYRSLGVEDPRRNFNFVQELTNSWARLRIDASSDQPVTQSDGDGKIEVFDFAQNALHLSGSGFEASASVILPSAFRYTMLSPKYDEAAQFQKVRVRSFQDFSNVQLYGGEVTPVYEVPRHEPLQDDPRFTMDFSVVDALNEDIVNMFSTFEALEDALGSPSLVFSEDYPDLDGLRGVYFDRLTDKVNLKSFFEFFRWIDTSLGMFIEQLVPRKTHFLGVNFVVEPHMLDRSKFVHRYDDVYLGDALRYGGRGEIRLQLVNGRVRRY